MSSPAPSDVQKRGLRVALLAAYLDNEYEWAICRGVKNAVEERGGSVVYVAGAGLSDPNPRHQARARFFELVGASNADAIVSVSGVIGHFIGASGAGDWLRRFGLPVSSIGSAKGVASVTVDDATGIGLLIEHLYLQHRRRKIAFVTGTPSSTEAQTRLSAYLRGLAAHGLVYDPKLVINGDFTRESGVRAVNELFDNRQVSLGEVDAIVASNDYSAFGVVDELVRRRIRVPDQVAVVGFDDITLARYHDPSLSTVRQPLDQLGREGANCMFALLDGRIPAQLTELPTELVLRRSCNCVPTDLPGEDEAPEGVEEPEEVDNTRNVLPALAAEINGATGAFSRSLEPLLRKLAAGSTYQLERNRRLADELATRLRLARQDLIHERLHRLSRALHSRMFSPQAQLSTVLAEHLPQFGLEECVVAEFVPDTERSELRLAFGFNAHELQPQSVTYPAHELSPASFPNLKSRSVVALPLCYDAELLGVAVLPAVDGDGSLYEALGETFGIVLKSRDLRRRAEARPK